MHHKLTLGPRGPGPRALELFPRSELRPVPDLATARELARALAAQPENRPMLRRALVELGGADAVPPRDDQLAELLARRLAAGDLLLREEPYLDSVRAEAPPPAAAAAPTPAEAEAAAKEERQTPPVTAADMQPAHWLEIRLVDDAGQPRAGERFFVELPDGSTRAGRLGSDGTARIEGVEPGTAKVSFPDLDREAYTDQ